MAQANHVRVLGRSDQEPAPQLIVSDPARFEKLVTENLDFVWRCLRRLGVTEADAEDAAQQVLLVAANRLDSITPGKERAFLFGTASRIAANARRAQKRKYQAHERFAEETGDPSPSQEHLADQLRARALLDQVMESMPDDLREVFVLFELEELTIKEISTALELSMGTVGSRLRRARKAFHDAVTRYKARSEFRVLA